MCRLEKILGLIFLLFMTLSIEGCGEKSDDKAKEFLNVSYDPTRELFATYNDRFGLHWHELTGEYILFLNSHGGSWNQAQEVIEGRQADVVSLALASDVDKICRAGLIKPDWIKRFPYNSAPYTSTIVFLVRKGNPKNIKDWDDLTREDVSIVMPNPKNSGGSRLGYLSAWEFAQRKFNGDQEQILNFMHDIFANVVALDIGPRNSVQLFVERQQGDVFIAWENEALMTMKKRGGYFDLIRPSISILAEPSVAIVDQVVDKRGTRKVAEEYINYLYSTEGQEIIARNFYRPRDPEIAQKYSEIFKPINFFTIEEAFGSWEKAQQDHFSTGGTFDQIYHN